MLLLFSSGTRCKTRGREELTTLQAAFNKCAVWPPGKLREATAAKAAVVNVTRSESHASSPGVAGTETRRDKKISSLADIERYTKIYIS